MKPNPLKCKWRSLIHPRSLPPATGFVLDNHLTNLARLSTTTRRAAVPFANQALLGRVDEAVHGTVVQNALLVVVGALAVGLGPHEAVKLAVALAAWARRTREVGVFLNEGLLAYLAVDPCGFGLGEERGGEDEVAGDTDGGRVVGVGRWAFHSALAFGTAFLFRGNGHGGVVELEVGL